MMFRRLGSLLGLIVLFTSGSANGEEPLSLRYKFTKGDRTIYRSQSSLKQVTTVMNTKIETTITQESIATRTVDDLDDKGNALVTIKTERLKVKMKAGPAGDYEFDSQSTERDSTSTLGQSLAPIYEKQASAQIQALVSPRGEVIEVKGYAELMADVVKNNPLGAQFAGGASNDAAKLGLQEVFMTLNESPVKPGEKWEVPRDFELPKLVKGKRKATFTYMGLEKLDGRTVAKSLALDETSMDLSTEAEGAQITGTFATSQSDGTVLFDVEAGRIVSLKSSITMGGQLTATVNEMAIPLQIEQTQTLDFELLK